MVSYKKWISIMFEVHGETNDPTEVMRVAASEWSQRKPDLLDASVSEARNHAKCL